MARCCGTQPISIGVPFTAASISLENLNEQIKRLIAQNSRYVLDQEEYNKTYRELADRYEASRAEYESVKRI